MPTAIAETCASSTPDRSTTPFDRGRERLGVAGRAGVGGSAELDASEHAVSRSRAPRRRAGSRCRCRAAASRGPERRERGRRALPGAASTSPAEGDDFDDALIVVVIVHREPHVDPIARQHERDRLAPLDDRDRESRAAPRSRGRAAPGCGPRRYTSTCATGTRPSYSCTIVNVGLVTGCVDAEPACQTLRDRGLARAEIAAQHDEVADPQLRRDRLADGLGLARARLSSTSHPVMACGRGRVSRARSRRATRPANDRRSAAPPTDAASG